MRAFLFDLDDTLFDHTYGTRVALGVVQAQLPCLRTVSRDDLEAQHALVLEEMHQRVLAGEIDIDSARVARFRRLASLHGAEPLPGEIEALAAAYRSAYVSARRATAGAIPLLRALREHGPIAVVSNNVLAEQIDKMAVCGLREHVDALVVSEEVGSAKPSPEIFRVALDRVRATPDRAVMIGDSWSADIVGARAAGIRAVWFNPFHRPCPDRSAIAAELHAWEPLESVVERILAVSAREARAQGWDKP